MCSGRRLSPRPPTPTPTQPESRNPCVWECCALVGLRLPRLGSTLHSTLSCHSTLVTSIPAFGLVKCPFTLRLGYGCLNRTRATCVHMDESYNNSAPSLFRVRLLFFCFLGDQKFPTTRDKTLSRSILRDRECRVLVLLFPEHTYNPTIQHPSPTLTNPGPGYRRGSCPHQHEG